MNPHPRLKGGEFCQEKGREGLLRQREWRSKEERQEAMGMGRGAASSLRVSAETVKQSSGTLCIKRATEERKC